MQTTTVSGPMLVAVLAVLLAAHTLADVLPAQMKVIEDEREHDALTEEEIMLMHARMDKDRDGKVSMDDVLTYHLLMRRAVAEADSSEILHDMDKDKDDHVSLEEMQKNLEERGHEAETKEHEAHKFAAADKDRDGRLSFEELPAHFYPELDEEVLHASSFKVLTRLDGDGDGMLTQEEFTGVKELAFGAKALDDEGPKRFQELDADGNQNLDLEELKHWMSERRDAEKTFKEMFKLADKDEDGHLTVEELGKARLDISELDAQQHLWDWREHGTWVHDEQEL